jgi:hypothetical protein
MIYMRVEWKHSDPDYPRFIYSELDDERMERRKIDIYPDGRWGFADEEQEVGGSGLGEAATPPLEEIAKNPEFEVHEIDKGEFDQLWAARSKARIWTPWPASGDGM